MYLQPKFGKQKLLHTYGGTMKKYKKAGTNNIVSLQIPNPICSTFWLHHTAHCTEKILSAHLRTGSVSPESGAGGGVTGRDGTSRGRWLVLIRYVCLHKAAL